MVDPARALVAYYHDVQLAVCALDGVDHPGGVGAVTVQMSTAPELARALFVLADWLRVAIEAIPSASVGDYIAGAYSDAAHVVGTSGRCGCHTCGSGRDNLAHL